MNRSCALVFVVMLALPGPPAPRAADVSVSPETNPIQLTRAALASAQHSIDVVVYKFDEKSLSRALIAAVDRGVRVRLLADAGQAKRKRSQVPRVHGAGAKVRVWKPGKLHVKFAVLDARSALSGSFNWTESAQHSNMELTFQFDDEQTVARFSEIFEALWHKAEPLDD